MQMDAAAAGAAVDHAGVEHAPGGAEHSDPGMRRAGRDDEAVIGDAAALAEIDRRRVAVAVGVSAAEVLAAGDRAEIVDGAAGVGGLDTVPAARDERPCRPG
jgi:hypothetical protein